MVHPIEAKIWRHQIWNRLDTNADTGTIFFLEQKNAEIHWAENFYRRRTHLNRSFPRLQTFTRHVRYSRKTTYQQRTLLLTKHTSSWSPQAQSIPISKILLAMQIAIAAGACLLYFWWQNHPRLSISFSLSQATLSKTSLPVTRRMHSCS